MKADISRDTFQAARDIRRVVAQQGRPWLDADWNEQVSVLLHRLETLAADVFGDYAAAGEGFNVEVVTDKSNKTMPKTFGVARGRYYVHGLMCENDEGWVSPPQQDFELEKPYLVFLHAWEEDEGGVQNPGITEPALRGVDTMGRTKVKWHIGWELVKDKKTAWEEFKRQRDRPAVRLRLRVKAGPASQDPGRAHGRTLYRGVENGTYRVEVHSAQGTGHVKWARNNASTLIAVSRDGARLTCATAGELNSSFERNGWIELHQAVGEASHGSGEMCQIKSIDRDGGFIELAKEPTGTAALFARPWAGFEVVKSGWFPLEQGLELSVELGEKRELRPGQYWILPVRTEGGGQVYWPTESDEGLANHWVPLDEDLSKLPGARPQERDLATHDSADAAEGSYRRRHYYGPLAFITFNSGGLLDEKQNGIEDLRNPYTR